MKSRTYQGFGGCLTLAPALPNSGQHQECKPGEVFVGDFPAGAFNNMLWYTGRIGENSFDENGDKIENAHPIFIEKTEWDNYWALPVKAKRSDAQGKPDYSSPKFVGDMQKHFGEARRDAIMGDIN